MNATCEDEARDIAYKYLNGLRSLPGPGGIIFLSNHPELAGVILYGHPVCFTERPLSAVVEPTKPWIAGEDLARLIAFRVEQQLGIVDSLELWSTKTEAAMTAFAREIVRQGLLPVRPRLDEIAIEAVDKTVRLRWEPPVRAAVGTWAGSLDHYMLGHRWNWINHRWTV